MRVAKNRFQLLSRCHPGNVPLRISGRAHILQGCNTHHEEFIQIGGRNGQEIQPLHQRVLFAPCLCQTSSVKLEPGQLPVKIVFRATPEDSLRTAFFLASLL